MSKPSLLALVSGYLLSVVAVLHELGDLLPVIQLLFHLGFQKKAILEMVENAWECGLKALLCYYWLNRTTIVGVTHHLNREKQVSLFSLQLPHSRTLKGRSLMLWLVDELTLMI